LWLITFYRGFNSDEKENPVWCCGKLVKLKNLEKKNWKHIYEPVPNSSMRQDLCEKWCVPQSPHLTVLASLHWLPVISSMKFKILQIKCKAVNGQYPLYLKNPNFCIYPTEHLAARLQTYFWFLEFLKAEWEAEPLYL